MIFADGIVSNKAFEHANLIFTEPWTLMNEITLNIKITHTRRWGTPQNFFLAFIDEL